MPRVGSAEWLKKLDRLIAVPDALLSYLAATEEGGSKMTDLGYVQKGDGKWTRDRAFDPVERPAHYASGSIECIDAIEAALGPDGFSAYLRGQVIKYNWRLGSKDAAEVDAGKARFYAARLEAHEKKRAALSAEHRENRA